MNVDTFDTGRFPPNPYRPAPGSEPPALVGRDEERAAADYSFRMIAAGAAAQPIVFTGLRGMGKTVLLRRCVADAEASGAVAISVEASDAEPIGVTLRGGLERALRENATVPKKLARALATLYEALPKAAFELPHDLGAFSLTPNDEPAAAAPFVELLEQVNAEVRRHGRSLLVAIDEIQDAPIGGLRDLVRFVHATAGTASPAALLAAGLPSSRDHLHKVRTYTERWRYFRLDLLTFEETKDAIAIPLRDRRTEIEPAALDRLAHESAGYPFFVQEYASAAWVSQHDARITGAQVERVIPGVRRLLEDDFYDARFRSLTPRECSFVLAMAELGPRPHTVGEIADQFGTTSATLSSIRNQLIKKDMIYAPATGMVEFRIPLTDRYVLDHRAEIERRAATSPITRRRGDAPRSP